MSENNETKLKAMSEKEKREFMKSFSKKLKETREKKSRISQTALAKKINVAASTISNYENLDSPNKNRGNNDKNDDKIARKFPTIYTAWKIAQALDVSLDELCGLKPESNTKIEETVEEKIEKEVRYIADALEGNAELLTAAKDGPYLIPQSWIQDDMTTFFNSYKKRLDTIEDFSDDYYMDENSIKEFKDYVVERFIEIAIRNYE